jgi:energy-coupling factor transporter ATP-binding protein EcfA2
VLQRVEVQNFKAFERFSLRTRGDTYLAGPNNAGKSTLIAALRSCAYMLRIAQRRHPTDTFQDGSTEVMGYYFNSAQVALVDENLRHEFRDLECRIVVHFARNRRLTAVWPVESDPNGPYFFLQVSGYAVTTARDAALEFPRLGVVPILSPIDQREGVRTPKYIRENIDGRLTSRHFRNQLQLLTEEQNDEEDYQAFLDFAEPWLSEIEVRDIASHPGEREVELDLWYWDAGRRRDKEIFWVGDGIQIWLQLLLHVFRLREADIVILDEPDVFLHPDLQRRLVRLLEELHPQTITATHSTEVLAEAPPEHVVWVDHTRRRSFTAPDTEALGELIGKLGSQFNIRLARALRSKVVLFVEGEDMRLIRHAASELGAEQVAREREITVIPLRGFGNWDRVEPFKWLSDELLQGSVKVFVVLDRDYRPDAACRSVKQRLARVGVRCTIWKKKELESYFLVPTVLSRLTGEPIEWIETKLAEIADGLEDEVFALFTTERQKLVSRDRYPQVVRQAKREFDELWAQPVARLDLSPPKDVLSGLNQALQSSNRQALSFPAIARAMTAEDIPHELAGVLERVEEAAQAET